MAHSMFHQEDFLLSSRSQTQVGAKRKEGQEWPLSPASPPCGVTPAGLVAHPAPPGPLRTLERFALFGLLDARITRG